MEIPFEFDFIDEESYGSGKKESARFLIDQENWEKARIKEADTQIKNFLKGKFNLKVSPENLEFFDGEWVRFEFDI